MTGDFDSIIGMSKEEPLQRFLRRIASARFEPASGRPRNPCRSGAAWRRAGRGTAGVLGLTAERCWSGSPFLELRGRSP
jgi:hypothetical protein